MRAGEVSAVSFRSPPRMTGTLPRAAAYRKTCRRAPSLSRLAAGVLRGGPKVALELLAPSFRIRFRVDFP